MGDEHPSRRAGPSSHHRPPGLCGLRQLDAGEGPVSEGVEQRRLAAQVVVGRHRVDAPLSADVAPAHLREPAPVGHPHRRFDDRADAEKLALRHDNLPPALAELTAVRLPSAPQAHDCKGGPVRAALFDRYGGPEVVRITEVPRPEPGRNDVLVQVRAAGDEVSW